jgi:hypothetical protein
MVVEHLLPHVLIVEGYELGPVYSHKQTCIRTLVGAQETRIAAYPAFQNGTGS